MATGCAAARLRADPRVDALFERGGRLVDLGCGDGTWLDAIAPRYGESIGFDIDPDPVASRLHPPATWRFVECDLDRGIPLATGSVDAVHAGQFIEHVDNPLVLFLEVHRVLRPGGVFVATTPNVRYLRHVAALVIRGEGPRTSSQRLRTTSSWDRGHRHFFTPGDLLWTASAAGFRDVTVRALVAREGRLRAVRRMLDRASRTWPVREFLSGNILLVARRTADDQSVAADTTR